MRQACADFAGREISDVAWARMQLPGPLGGMGLTLPKVSADAAFVASWQATAHRASTVCRELGRPTSVRVDEQEYEAAVDLLRALGVVVSMSREVQYTTQARQQFLTGPWSEDTTESEILAFTPRATDAHSGEGSKLNSRIMRAMHALKATQFHANLTT